MLSRPTHLIFQDSSGGNADCSAYPNNLILSIILHVAEFVKAVFRLTFHKDGEKKKERERREGKREKERKKGKGRGRGKRGGKRRKGRRREGGGKKEKRGRKRKRKESREKEEKGRKEGKRGEKKREKKRGGKEDEGKEEERRGGGKRGERKGEMPPPNAYQSQPPQPKCPHTPKMAQETPRYRTIPRPHKTPVLLDKTIPQLAIHPTDTPVALAVCLKLNQTPRVIPPPAISIPPRSRLGNDDFAMPVILSPDPAHVVPHWNDKQRRKE